MRGGLAATKRRGQGFKLQSDPFPHAAQHERGRTLVASLHGRWGSSAIRRLRGRISPIRLQRLLVGKVSAPGHFIGLPQDRAAAIVFWNGGRFVVFYDGQDVPIDFQAEGVRFEAFGDTISVMADSA